MKKIETVLVTGGAGYVGSALIPKLLNKGYKVKVFDLFLYGHEVFDAVRHNPNLIEIEGDLRNQALVDSSLRGVDAVIHLACISNDPSFELNPDLGKSINYDCFRPLVQSAKKNKVSRFIYASSSSVYGVKEEENVHEGLSLEPLTDYSKFKAMCETVLLEEASDDLTCLIVRPATVCGYSPRLRLDLSVNILTNFAVNKGEIAVFGGAQKRPNIHIEDMTDFYVKALEWEHKAIHKKIYNAGYENFTIDQIADMVSSVVGGHVKIKHVPTNDIRSYHISSKKLQDELGFSANHTISDAVKDLKDAFDKNLIHDSFANSKYFNIKRMQEINLK